MSAMVKRNLKIYFRDKASVFFSMLSVIIIFALYILFIGDSVNSGLKVSATSQSLDAGLDASRDAGFGVDHYEFRSIWGDDQRPGE